VCLGGAFSCEFRWVGGCGVLYRLQVQLRVPLLHERFSRKTSCTLAVVIALAEWRDVVNGLVMLHLSTY
jgi:hypothetical protein